MALDIVIMDGFLNQSMNKGMNDYQYIYNILINSMT